MTAPEPKGLSLRTIAKLLGVSKGTVRSIEQRALAKMRAKVEESGHTFESLLDREEQVVKVATKGNLE